jgi:very-short-patch-repair endonuclease
VRFARHFALPKPHTNVPIAGYRVDALYEQHQLIIELDSWEFHHDRRAFEHDRERDATTLALGYSTIRITWARLTGLSDREANRLRAILTARQP